MLVKICGISNWIDAKTAIDAGADAIGLVMGGNVLPPEVEPHAQTVREMIKQFPAHVDSFLVTHLTEVDDILSLSDYIGSTGIQISEDLEIEKLKEIRQRTTKKIIKTVVVQDLEKSLQRLKEVELFADFILLDTRLAGYVGGTGATNDWNICQKLIAAATKPVYLAGGLNPENLERALQQTRPQGTDVSTGVSVYSPIYLKKDRKDSEKIKRFIQLSKAFV